MPPLDRGREIEEMVGATRHGRANFPVVDRWVPSEGIATSIKSLDLTADSYQKANNLKSKVRGYINEIRKFTGAQRGELSIYAADIKGRRLTLVVPPRKTSDQKQALDEMKIYATQRGVDLDIRTVP
jgi:hypothetical protein